MSSGGLGIFDTTVQEPHYWLKLMMQQLQTNNRRQAFSALPAGLHVLRDRIDASPSRNANLDAYGVARATLPCSREPAIAETSGSPFGYASCAALSLAGARSHSRLTTSFRDSKSHDADQQF
jgi:hypothetical protein